MPPSPPSAASHLAPAANDEPGRIWERALQRLRAETTEAHFETYLKATRGLEYDAGAAVLRVAAGNSFHVPWLEGRFGSAIHAAVADVLAAPVRVEFVAEADPRLGGGERQSVRERPRPAPNRPMDALWEDGPAPPLPHQAPASPAGAPAARLAGSPLNSRYTFDTFIVGESNRLAHAASEASAAEPGRAYNPLFLYGGVGLGKTHLLHAVGHAVLAQGLSVVYVSSETFTNELIESIRQHRMDDFRGKYRRAGLLLIDDIQFIAGKERTEEEFFHTFNAVHEAGGQIVLSSDRLPRAMTILEDRLRSRFEWGLIADVQPPDYETRIAILRSKLAGMAVAFVPAEVVDFIAQKVQSNIRELEGTLNRLLAHARHLNRPVTIDLAASVLHDLATPASGVGATPERVLEAVCRFYGVSRVDLKGKARHKEIVVPRQVAMYLLREDTRLSTPDIGKLLSRDHTTVIHGVNLVAHDLSRDGPMRAALRGVREILTAAENARGHAA